MSMQDMREFLVGLCQSLGGMSSEDANKYRTHSLKATPLSWLAKAGSPMEVRRVLGYHLKPGDKMPTLYARDALAAPAPPSCGASST